MASSSILMKHPPPVLSTAFATTHDTYYQREDGPGLQSKPITTSAFTNDRPFFCSQKGMSDMQSTARSGYGQGDPSNIVSTRKPTAHVRNQPGDIVSANTDRRMGVSTAKASFTSEAAAGSAKPSNGRRTMYAGNSAVQFNPRAFAIDEPDTPPKKPVVLPEQPRCKINRGGMPHIFAGPMEKDRASDAYGKHHGIRGDAARELPHIPNTAGHPRAALMHAAGRASMSSRQTEQGHYNPIRLGPKEEERTRVSRRVETEGHVRMSMMKSSFTNQVYQPETEALKVAANAKIHPSEKKLEAKVVIDDANKKALDSLGTTADRPERVHPSVWARIQAFDKTQTTTGGDPHAHKKHDPIRPNASLTASNRTIVK